MVRHPSPLARCIILFLHQGQSTPANFHFECLVDGVRAVHGYFQCDSRGKYLNEHIIGTCWHSISLDTCNTVAFAAIFANNCPGIFCCRRHYSMAGGTNTCCAARGRLSLLTHTQAHMVFDLYPIDPDKIRTPGQHHNLYDRIHCPPTWPRIWKPYQRGSKIVECASRYQNRVDTPARRQYVRFTNFINANLVSDWNCRATSILFISRLKSGLGTPGRAMPSGNNHGGCIHSLELSSNLTSSH